MISLSVNVNKITTLRNARGGNIPNLLEHAKNIIHLVQTESQFILDLMKDTTYNDVRELKKNIMLN